MYALSHPVQLHSAHPFALHCPLPPSLQDVAELARLKILGSKLKKSAARKEPPSVVLQAMQQQRQVAEGTTTGGGAPSLPAPLDVSQQGSTAAAVVPAVVSPSTAAGEAGRVGSRSCGSP